MALFISAMQPMQVTLGMSDVWMLGPNVLSVGVRLTNLQCNRDLGFHLLQLKLWSIRS